MASGTLSDRCYLEIDDSVGDDNTRGSLGLLPEHLLDNFEGSSLILLDVERRKTGEDYKVQSTSCIDIPPEGRGSLSSLSSISTTSTVQEYTDHKSLATRLSSSLTNNDARDSWEGSRMSLMHTYGNQEDVPLVDNIDPARQKKLVKPLPASLSKQIGVVTALLSDPIDANYDQDEDLDVTQTDVILDNDDLVDLDVDFSYAEGDESESDSAAGFSDSWCFSQTGDECKSDDKKSVLPSIQSAIQSSVDFMLTSDSDEQSHVSVKRLNQMDILPSSTDKQRSSLYSMSLIADETLGAPQNHVNGNMSKSGLESCYFATYNQSDSVNQSQFSYQDAVDPFGNSITTYFTAQEAFLPKDIPAPCNGAVYVDENGDGVTDLAYLHPLVDADLMADSSFACAGEIESEFFGGDEDFKPAVDCLAMLDEDQKQFEKENHFAQTDAMDILGCLDFTALSNCVSSANTSAACVRISIGEFMASQSEALGSLDGSLCTVRPAFGTDITTPPNNRAPVVLLQLETSSGSAKAQSPLLDREAEADQTYCVDDSAVAEDGSEADNTMTTTDLRCTPSSINNSSEERRPSSTVSESRCSPVSSLMASKIPRMISSMNVAAPIATPSVHDSNSTTVPSSVARVSHPPSVSLSTPLPVSTASVSVYEPQSDIRKFTSAIRASNSKDEVNRLIKLFSTSSPFVSGVDKNSEKSNFPVKVDKHASSSDLASAKIATDVETNRVDVSGSLDCMLASSTKSYSWNSSLPNGSKLESTSAISSEEAGILNQLDKPSNDARLSEQDSISLDKSAVGMAMHPAEVEANPSKRKQSVSINTTKENVHLNSRQKSSMKNSRKTVRASDETSGLVDTTLQTIVKPKLASDTNQQPSVLRSIENVSENARGRSQEQTRCIVQSSFLGERITQGRKTLRIRDVVPSPSHNDGDSTTAFVSPRRSSIIRQARQSAHDDSRRFNQSHIDQSRFDQSAILLSSTLRLPDTDMCSSQLSMGSLMDTILDSTSAIPPTVRQYQLQSITEDLHSPAVHYKTVQTHLPDGVSLSSSTKQSTPVFKAQKRGKMASPVVGLTISLPDDFVVASSCCVGSTVSSILPIFNSNCCDIDVRFNVGPVNLDGRVVDRCEYSPFSIQCVNMQLASGVQQDLKITFSPSIYGLHKASLNVFALTALSSNGDSRQKVTLSNREMSGCTYQTSIILKAFADQPRVQFQEQANGGTLNFGSMTWSSNRRQTLSILNPTLSRVPIKLIITSASNIYGMFTLCVDKPDPVRTLSSAIADNVYHCTLHPATSTSSGISVSEQPVTVRFRAPGPPLNPSGLGVANLSKTFKASLDVVVDHPTSPICVCSYQMVAVVATARLHTNMEAVNFVAIPGQTHDFTVPLRNAGMLPFEVSVEVSHHQEFFAVTPAMCTIEPGGLSHVNVRFSTPLNTTSPVYKSLLLLYVEPDGPNYEIAVVGTVSKRSTAPHLSRRSIESLPDLLSNTNHLAFGGVPLGKSAEQSIMFKNNTYDLLKVRLEIHSPSMRSSSDYQIIMSYMNKEIRVTSKDIILKSLEEQLVQIRFTPSRCACIDAKIRVRLVNSATKYTIPLTGYGGLSRLKIDNLPLLANQSSVYCQELKSGPAGQHVSTTATVVNAGSRATYVKAVAFKDLACSTLMKESVIEIMPAEFCLKADSKEIVRVTWKNAGQPDAQSTVVISFYFGDELSRQKYRRALHCGAVARVELPTNNPLAAVNFDATFIGENDIEEGASNAMLSPSDATQFLSNMGYITMLLVAESASPSQQIGSTAGLTCQVSDPTSSTIGASGVRQGLEIPGVGWRITEDELRSNSPPVKGSPVSNAVSPSPIVSVMKTQRRDSVSAASGEVASRTLNLGPSAYLPLKAVDQWCVDPQRLVIDDDNSVASFSIINNSQTTLQFDLCSSSCLEVNPRRGFLPTRNVITVSVKLGTHERDSQSNSSSNHHINVNCHGVVKTVYVQIAHQAVGIMSESGASTHNNVALSKQLIQFSPTLAHQTSFMSYVLSNTERCEVRWSLTYVTATYLQSKQNVPHFRVLYSVFETSPISGVIKPGERQSISIRFTPAEGGKYAQHMDIAVEPQTGVGVSRVIKLELVGEGFAVNKPGVLTGEAGQLTIGNSNSSTASSLSLKPLRSSRQPLVIVSPDKIDFPASCHTGKWSACKLMIRNRDRKDIVVEVDHVTLPFFVPCSRFTVQARHFAKLPVECRPAESGDYRSTLRLNIDNRETLNVELSAQIKAQIDS